MTQYGFACRNTSGYVTDNAPDTYLRGDTGDDDYPVTRNGITFGWTTAGSSFVASRNRNNGIDVRFAGIVFSANVLLPCELRVDLPSSGGWTLRCAIGDATYTQTNMSLSLKDDSSEFATVTGDTSGSNQYLDATGVNRSSPADWVSNNIALSHTFSTTILRLTFGDGLTKNAVLAYLLLEDSGTGPDFTFIKPWMIA